MRVRLSLPALALVLCAALSGCGGGGVSVDGKVVKDGAAYTLAEGEGLSINLASEDGKAGGSGTVNKDGTFTIKSAGDKPVAPGKYKVSLTHYKPADAKKGPAQPDTKQLSEAWEVSGGSKSFTIDIAKLK
jgi:hypothetical protein